MNQPPSLLEQLAAFAALREIGLPVISPTAMQLLAHVRSGEADPRQVERLVQSDQALAAEVLRAANSPFFGGLTTITTVQGAIVRLGMQQVARLVVLAAEHNRYTARHPAVVKLMAHLWAHASACAHASEWLARRLGHRNLEEEVFVGGLVHDVGKLYLARVLDEMQASLEPRHDVPEALVLELLAQAHADQGYRLVADWNLPEIYRVIVRDHHTIDPDPTNVALLIVRLANRACHKLGIGLVAEPSVILATLPESAMLLAGEIMLAELEVLLEDLTAVPLPA
jgi:HD-like signal output (HDOD) protein